MAELLPIIFYREQYTNKHGVDMYKIYGPTEHYKAAKLPDTNDHWQGRHGEMTGWRGTAEEAAPLLRRIRAYEVEVEQIKALERKYAEEEADEIYKVMNRTPGGFIVAMPYLGKHGPNRRTRRQQITGYPREWKKAKLPPYQHEWRTRNGSRVGWLGLVADIAPFLEALVAYDLRLRNETPDNMRMWIWGDPVQELSRHYILMWMKGQTKVKKEQLRTNLGLDNLKERNLLLKLLLQDGWINPLSVITPEGFREIDNCIDILIVKDQGEVDGKDMLDKLIDSLLDTEAGER